MSKSKQADKILIGRVVSAHGLKGEISILPLTDYPERFEAMEFISLYKHGKFFRELEIFDSRVRGENLILATDLEDRDAAEECVGAEILIDPDERVDLPPGEYWIDDLIGLTVEDLDGRVLGTVSNLILGANELYEICDSRGKLHYIPAVQEFIREINLEARGQGKIRVALIEGLWED